MIPVISWIILHGRCRTCKNKISWLYPFIEMLTAIIMTLLIIQIPLHFVPAYFILFSALIVTIRTDIETMLISRFTSLFLVPVGTLFSVLKLLPLSPFNSILGAMIGYLIPYIFSKIFKYFTGKEGIGAGDFELLACIGAFTGILGCWLSLVIGSLLGSLFGLTQLISGKASRSTKIPFGPFLAVGCIIFVLLQNIMLKFFLF